MRIKNVIKTYPNGITALKGVTFVTPDSGFICITGESGSGKTTLLNCLFGAEDFEGEIEICGTVMTTKNRDAIRRQYISMIYQDYRLIEDLSVEENLKLAADAVGVSISDEDIIRALTKVGLNPEYSKHKITTLSGGEKQRVGVARAIIQRAKILLADEPTGNLDSRNSREIFKLLKEISQDILIIAVTHNTTLKEEFADNSLELMDGVIIHTDLSREKEERYIANNMPLRKTRLSKRTYFTLMRQTGKNKFFSIMLSMFCVVFLVAAFISSSFMLANEYNIEKRNIDNRSEHALTMIGAPIAQNDFGEIKEKLYYGFYLNSSKNASDIIITDDVINLDANYLKDYRIDDTANIAVECDDAAQLGNKLICGRNVNNYNEIVVNESFAYYAIIYGSANGRKLERYEDLMGVKHKGFTIVGVMDGKYDKYNGEFKLSTNRDFLKADQRTREKMISLQIMLNNNIDAQYNLVKEGYTESMRNSESAANIRARKYLIVDMQDDGLSSAHGNGSVYEIHDGEEYNTFDGDSTTIVPGDNEIVLNAEILNGYMFPIKKPSAPFYYEFMIGAEYYNLRVIGYTTDGVSYVNNNFAALHANNEERVYDYVFFSSKTKKKNIDVVFEILKDITPENQNIKFLSGYSNNIDEIGTFLIDYRIAFNIIFSISVILLIAFNVFSVYIVMRQRRDDILTMRALGMEKEKLTLVYASAFAAAGVAQVIISYAIYGGLIAALNQLLKNSLPAAFNTLFFELLPVILSSVVFIVIGVLFAAQYMTRLFSNSIGDRIKKG